MEIFLMMVSGPVRNTQSTLSNKFEKLCISLAFVIKIRRQMEMNVQHYATAFLPQLTIDYEVERVSYTAKQLVFEFGHSSPSSAEDKKEWRYNPTPGIYSVSQEECARLREGVPYVNVYRYNPKHLCPKLNGYGDKGARKVWSSCGSTYCTWFA